MAKVIREGLPDKWWIGEQVTCPACFCIAEVEEADNAWAKYTTSGEQVRYIRCPECTRDIPFNPSEDLIPSNG